MTSNNAIIMTVKYGNKYFITDSIVTPPTLQPVNRIVPTEGVIVPTERSILIDILDFIVTLFYVIFIGNKIESFHFLICENDYY